MGPGSGLFSNRGQYETLKKRGLEIVQRCFESIERSLILGGEDYAVVGRFTAVAAYLFVLYRWGTEIGVDMQRLFPKYAALANAVAERPSTVAALAAGRGFEDWLFGG
ncbi:glutathione S-transferase GST-6.0 [Penicillium alfredii]|uniref:Glutathione S-transferase GST-6.0 n=1 Tax=Penicillium alfredii TaxID=1506179 RepID=A0A9W9G9P4_9EURO|nr:glutathione S-transferase GST-6.0 [Penicillium alfredii]KAJ5114714.1 glutathione S-transferase GST-6.0 [Penicillium alfredii]